MILVSSETDLVDYGCFDLRGTKCTSNINVHTSSKVVTRVEAPVTNHLGEYAPHLEKYKMVQLSFV